jgi:phage gpG-like protein
MDANNFGKLTGAKLATLERYFKNDAQLMVVRETLRFIDDNFRMQGWQGPSFQPWKPNKRGSQILIRSGALHRGFAYHRQDDGVLFYNNIPYGRVHNEGLTINRPAHSETFVRNRHTSGKRQGLFKKGTTLGHGFTFGAYQIQMPQRQFAPTAESESPVFNSAIMKYLENDIKNILTF